MMKQIINAMDRCRQPGFKTRAFIVVTCSIIIFPLVFMAFDNVAPYTYISGSIMPNPAEDGSSVTIDWTVARNRSCPGHINRIVTDARGVVHIYDAGRAPADRDDDGHLIRKFQLPAGMPLGDSEYRALTCYACNALQKWFPLCATTPSIPFRITKPTN